MENKAFSKHEQLWHRRLAHLNMPNVKKLIGEHETEDESDPITENCQICYEGKMKRSPFPKKSFNREEDSLKPINSDVVGPISPIFKGGNKYIVTFIDDFSLYCEVGMMKTKHEVFKKFVEYKTKVENIQGRKISCLRSKNERIFVKWIQRLPERKWYQSSTDYSWASIAKRRSRENQPNLVRCSPLYVD
ncbi:hypothetical protein JTB14_029014 [Gonioctena quinquepunctata]|nr:hypothetical protein JTB14_029014 [Gonioctena quinquepunctata]